MTDSADDQQARATRNSVEKMRKWTPEQWEAQRKAIADALATKRTATTPAKNTGTAADD